MLKEKKKKKKKIPKWWPPSFTPAAKGSARTPLGPMIHFDVTSLALRVSISLYSQDVISKSHNLKISKSQNLYDAVKCHKLVQV